MIKQIQNDTGGAVESMQRGTEQVEKGRELARKAGTAMQDIVKAALGVGDMVSQVATASEEQSSAAEEISRNIEGISSATQQSAAATQQVARAAEDLNRLTENLQQLIQQFKVSNNREHRKQFSERESGMLLSD
jgi:methyl-accepting chemotaxis protein